MEEFICNELASVAKELGATVLKGIYIPTGKNVLVKELYQRLGFSLIAAEREDVTVWQLDLSNYMPRGNFITRKMR